MFPTFTDADICKGNSATCVTTLAAPANHFTNADAILDIDTDAVSVLTNFNLKLTVESKLMDLDYIYR